MEVENENPLIKNIDKVLCKFGFDEKYLQTALFHLKIAKEHLFKKEKQFQCRQDLIDTLLSKLFLDEPDIFPPKRYASQVDENFEWRVPPLPAEAFGKEKFLEIRENFFFECLKVGDILDCRVVSVLPVEYCLRVIHKYGSERLLEDLDILVTLPRIKLENNFPQNDLAACELVRVGVSHIEGKNVKVTLDENAVPITENIKLGRLPETSLPRNASYATAFAGCATFTDYLHAHPGFQDSVLLNYELQAYGYDVNKVSSYYSEFNNLKRSSEQLPGQALLEEARKNDLKTHLNAAIKDFQERNFPAALDAIQLALELDDKCIKLYDVRGAIYEDLLKPKMSLKALWDFETVHKLDENNSAALKKISKAQSKTAIKFYKKQQYKKAAVAAEGALTLDKDNVSASKLLTYLKESHPECLKNLHEEENNMKKEKSDISSNSLLSVKAEPVD